MRLSIVCILADGAPQEAATHGVHEESRDGMKILHIMAGLGEASGVANVARRFARVQSERGDAVALLAPAFKWNPVCFGLAFAVRAWRRAYAADAIWVHCSWTFPVWFGAWLARRTGKRLVAVPEGSFDPKRLHNKAAWKKRLVAPLDRWVLRQSDEVLALCPDERQWILAFEPRAKVRLAAVPVFVPEMENVQGMKTEVSGHGRGADCPLRVLFLGRAEDPLKGVRYLERAVADLNGGTATAQSGGSVSAIELRVESRVFGAAKEAAWEWCDVLCLPTLSDNFGLVVAEALEHGKRVVTTDGAPAWGGGNDYGGRLVYLRGFRDGTDDERLRLLKGALVDSFRSIRSHAVGDGWRKEDD